MNQKKKKVVKKLNNHPIFKIEKTYGQKAADYLTEWAGSWAFILGFLLFITLWIILNVYILPQQITSGKPFDPYPFILLNLALSLLAAIQAPVILMSQNRQAQKDRLKAEYDYRIDKKAEKEIQAVKKQINRIEKFIIGKGK